MRFIAIVFVVLLAVLCSTAGAAGFLRVQGQSIVDESGKKVLLRGVGLGNWMLPEGYMWQFGSNGDRPRRIEKLVSDLIGPADADRFWREYRANYVAEGDIGRIAELGFNCVRPALNARLFLGEGDKLEYLAEGFELLDNLVSWCRKQHVYVIIDVHAAPGGQTGANIDDSRDDRPELFADPRNQDRLVELWVKIADRYKDEPTVGAYDLLNEPLPRRTGAEDRYKSQLEPLYRRITRAIRTVDRRHVITLEGADWANDWSVFTRPFDPNLVYQFHYYCWDKPDKLNDISRYLAARKKLDRPIWCGETGEKDNAIYWATTQYFEANNVGWSFWPWKKMESRNGICSIKAPEGWDEVRAFSRGEGKPSAEAARKAFAQLARNVRIENCTVHGDVISALLHRVPGRIEAENYGPDGPNRSYLIRAGTKNSLHYRPSGPVPIVVIENREDRWSSEQAIRLSEGEWTAYAATSEQSREYTPTIRVKGDPAPARLRLSAGRPGEEVSISAADWTEVKLDPVRLSAGHNAIKLDLTRGSALIDWIEFEPKRASENR